MIKARSATGPRSRPGSAPQPSLHRSGVVARMLGMPVATLRVWERRYAVTHAAMSAGGQRMYSADDVRRLALIRRLTGLGHAISSLAALDMTQLQGVSSAHAETRVGAQAAADVDVPPQRAWRLVVVGQALGRRVTRPAFLRQLRRPLDLVGPFDDLAQAAAALGAPLLRQPVDAWLLHEPHLHADWRDAVEAVMPGLMHPRSTSRSPGSVAVLYGFAADSVCETLATDGVALLREPQADVTLAQWLRHWVEAAAVSASRVATDAAEARVAGTAPPPRRWDDAALAEFASRSNAVACDCPRHVAELLMQLSRFEAYSASCGNRSEADAGLHALLGRMTADARRGFETALEQVAMHQGLILPTDTLPAGGAL